MRYGQHKVFAGMQRGMLLEIWGKLCAQARAIGREDLIAKYQFPQGAGYRRIDRSTAPFQRELDELIAQGATALENAPPVAPHSSGV